MANTFAYATSATSIILPDSVETIGAYSFQACSSLTSIILPNTIVEIGTGAFASCSNLKTLKLPSSLSSITAGVFTNSAIETIDFGNNTNLTALGEIIDNISQIASSENGVFNFEQSLKKIDLSGCTNLKTIGDMAFDNCINLETLLLPDSIEEVGYAAFSGCSSLNYYEIEGVKYLGNENNKNLVLVRCTDNTIISFEVPEGTKVICNIAFRKITSLAQVKIPTSVTFIGGGAFDQTAIRSVWVPSTTKMISYLDVDGNSNGPFYLCCNYTSNATYQTFYSSNGITVYTDSESAPSLWTDNGKKITYDKEFTVIGSTTYAQYLTATGNEY